MLGAVPGGFRPIVVDNGSSDGTADVARGLGATVIDEPRPGYGAAVHAGVMAATSEYVAVVDGDDSMDLGELPKLLGAVIDDGVTMAVGRRRPVGRGVWPWHARAGTRCSRPGCGAPADSASMTSRRCGSADVRT